MGPGKPAISFMGGSKWCPVRFHPTIGVTIIYQPCFYFIELCYVNSPVYINQDIHHIIENIVNHIFHIINS